MYFCCLEAMQNACKHAGERASIRLRVREEAGTLTFEVTDDGAGFDAAGRGSARGCSTWPTGSARSAAACGWTRPRAEGTRVTGMVCVAAGARVVGAADQRIPDAANPASPALR